MGFKHAPGCSCCNTCSNFCNSIPETIDIEFAPILDRDCGDCGDLDGTYTLSLVDEFTVGLAGSGFGCKYEYNIPSPNPGSCPRYNLDTWIRLEIGNQTGSDIVSVYVGQSGALVFSASESGSNFSPSDWFTDGDCTAALEITTSGDGPGGNGFFFEFSQTACEIDDDSVFTLNPI